LVSSNWGPKSELAKYIFDIVGAYGLTNIRVGFEYNEIRLEEVKPQVVIF
jgi:hypothetical protein